MATWGVGSFENDAAVEWFYLVEEAVDPGQVIAAALDEALAETDDLGLDIASVTIAAAELSASCAGEVAETLPDPVRRWVLEHPHEPHREEVALAAEAVERVRDESELRDLWDEELGSDRAWQLAVDDLLNRLKRSGTDVAANLRP